MAKEKDNNNKLKKDWVKSQDNNTERERERERERESNNLSNSETTNQPGWKARFLNIARNAFYMSAIYGVYDFGYYQGVNSTANQLSLNQPDFTPHCPPCLPSTSRAEYQWQIDLQNAQQDLNQQWIDKGLLDPQEVQSRYTKLEQEKNEWKTNYEDLILLFKELGDEWEKCEYCTTVIEVAKAEPSRYPKRLEKIVEEWALVGKKFQELANELEQKPNLTWEEYNVLSSNQKPATLPNDWKEKLAKIPHLETKIKNLKLLIAELEKRSDLNATRYKELRQKEKTLANRPNITLTEWEQDYSQRPTRQELDDKIAEINRLLNNQKPTDLPENWKTKLNHIPNLEQKIKDLELRPNQTQWEKVNNDLTARTTERNNLKTDLKTEQTKHAETKQTLSTTQNDLATAQKAQADAEKAQKQAEQARDAYRTNYENEQTAHGETKKALITAETAQKEAKTKLQKELDQTKKDKELLQQATEKLYQERQNNLNQISQLKAINTELNKRPTQNQLDTANQAKSHAENNLQKTKQDLITAQQERDARPNITNEKWAKTQQTLQQTQTDLKKSQNDLARTTAERDKRANITPDELKALNERKNYLELENTFYKEDLFDLKEELTKSNQNNEKLTQGNKLKTDRINRLTSHTEIMANRYKDANNNYKETQAELKAKTTQLQEVHQENDKLKGANTYLEGRIAALQNEILNSGKQQHQQTILIDDLTNELTETKTNLKQAQDNLTTTEKANRHTKIALKKEQIKYQQTVSERDNYNKHRDKTLTELSEERNNHYQTQQNLATTTEERNKAQEQQTKLARELAQSQNENSKLEGQITHLQNEAIQAEKQNAEKEAIINGLEAEKEAAQAGLEAFNQQLNEVNQELIREKRAGRKLFENNTHLQTLINQLETDNQAKTTENSEWKTKYEKLNQEYENKTIFFGKLMAGLTGTAAGYGIKHTFTAKEYEELTEEVEKLINHWRNHRCKTCPHNDYNTIKQERNDYQQQRDNLQAWKDNHNCPTCQQTCCVNGDYATIKEQLNQQAEQIQQLTAKEKQIITQIITECQLGLNTDSVLEAVITRIKELINKGPDSQIITDLQRQLQNKDQIIADLSTPSEEIKQQLLKLSQELGLSDQVQQSLQNASSYQELVSKQGQAFSEKIQGEIKQKQMAQNWNIGLGVLSGTSLLVLAWLVVRLRAGKGKERK